MSLDQAPLEPGPGRLQGNGKLLLHTPPGDFQLAGLRQVTRGFDAQALPAVGSRVRMGSIIDSPVMAIS